MENLDPNTQNPKQTDDATSESKKDKRATQFFWFIVLPVLLLMKYFGVFDSSQDYPKLASFGTHDWSVVCKENERAYRLYSNNPTSQQGWQSVIRRKLSFLDEQGKTHYATARFDEVALDGAGVWRFSYHKLGDVNPLARDVDRQKVLYGDESQFDIDEHFQWLNVTLHSGEVIRLDCQVL